MIGLLTRAANQVALTYTINPRWQNREEFFSRPDAIAAFLQRT